MTRPFSGAKLEGARDEVVVDYNSKLTIDEGQVKEFFNSLRPWQKTL